jgi:hypothetical protein
LILELQVIIIVLLEVLLKKQEYREVVVEIIQFPFNM